MENIKGVGVSVLAKAMGEVMEKEGNLEYLAAQTLHNFSHRLDGMNSKLSEQPTKIGKYNKIYTAVMWATLSSLVFSVAAPTCYVAFRNGMNNAAGAAFKGLFSSWYTMSNIAMGPASMANAVTEPLKGAQQSDYIKYSGALKFLEGSSASMLRTLNAASEAAAKVGQGAAEIVQRDYMSKVVIRG